MPPKRDIRRRSLTAAEAVQAFTDTPHKATTLKIDVPAEPEPEPEPEPEEGTSRVSDALELVAQCAVGACALGLAVFGLRATSHQVSRDVVFVSVSSLFCLCGAASVGAACTEGAETELQKELKREQSLGEGEDQWVNKLVTALWPSINDCAMYMKEELIEPMVQQSVPSMRFVDFDLGEETPKLTFRKVHSRVGNQGVILQIDVVWSSKSKISMAAGHALKFGVRSITFAGTLYVVLSPIVLEPPVVGAVQLYFIDSPEIELHYTGAAALARLPGVKRQIQRAIDDSFASMLVLPNRMSFPLAYGLDYAGVTCPPPLGIIWVRPIKAERVLAADIHLLSAATSDPYVVFELGGQRYRSKTILKNLNPVWEEDDGMWLLVNDIMQSFELEVFDQDDLSSDDFIGVIEPQQLTKLLSVKAKTCESQPLFKTVELPLYARKPASGQHWTDQSFAEDAGKITLDVKWCPVVLSKEIERGKVVYKRKHRIRTGARALVAVKVRTIRAALRDGNEARISATLSDGTSAKTNPAWEVPVDFGRLEDVYERVVKNMSQKIGLVKGDDAMIGEILDLESDEVVGIRARIRQKEEEEAAFAAAKAQRDARRGKRTPLSSPASPASPASPTPSTPAPSSPARAVSEVDMHVEQKLMVETVMYIPVEMDESVGLSINLLISKVGELSNANSHGAEPAAARAEKESAAAAFAAAQVSPRTGSASTTATGSSSHHGRLLTLAAHDAPTANGGVTRSYTLGELNELIGAPDAADGSVANGWLTETLHFTPPSKGVRKGAGGKRRGSLPSTSSGGAASGAEEMLCGPATAEISLRLYSCGLVS